MLYVHLIRCCFCHKKKLCDNTLGDYSDELMGEATRERERERAKKKNKVIWCDKMIMMHEAWKPNWSLLSFSFQVKIARADYFD